MFSLSDNIKIIYNNMEKHIVLKQGSTLGICAPSARFDVQKLNMGIEVIKNLGFNIKVVEDIFKKKRYLAGDDSVRANIINRFFADPGIGGIICARGGFGAMRTLGHLDWDLIKQNPKPFIGFSDSTAILLAIIDKTGNPVIHGPNVVSLASASHKTLDSFYKVLTGSLNKIELANAKVLKPGKCQGVFKGGNIATISHLLGTRFQPSFKNAVLFLEDIGEPAYKIDRMLTQMKMTGMFKEIKGVITGSFEDCDNEEYIEEILLETFEEYDVPVFAGLKSGHGKVNLSLRMGVEIEMDTKKTRILWT